MGRPEEGRLERVIAEQTRCLRLARGATVTEMAVRVGISKAMLSKVENAQTSCSLTTLARLADALDEPVGALFADTDDERGPPRRMEARMVTLSDRDEELPVVGPQGAGLLSVLDGVMVYGHGARRHTLHPGDALALDAGDPHGPLELVELVEPPVRFLSVVAHGV